MAKRHDESDVNAPYRHTCHRKPVTRREFLGQGFISGAAMVMAPNALERTGG